MYKIVIFIPDILLILSNIATPRPWLRAFLWPGAFTGPSAAATARDSSAVSPP